MINCSALNVTSVQGNIINESLLLCIFDRDRKSTFPETDKPETYIELHWWLMRSGIGMMSIIIIINIIYFNERKNHPSWCRLSLMGTASYNHLKVGKVRHFLIQSWQKKSYYKSSHTSYRHRFIIIHYSP